MHSRETLLIRDQAERRVVTDSRDPRRRGPAANPPLATLLPTWAAFSSAAVQALTIRLHGGVSPPPPWQRLQAGNAHMLQVLNPQPLCACG